MQNYLDRLNKWTLDWGTKLSKTKTVFMLFTKKISKIDNFALKSGDKLLLRVSEFKFLFVTFDTQLTFIAHINNITKH